MQLFQDIELTPSFSELFILMTNRCNLTCKHCYVSSGPKEPYGLELSMVINIIDEAVRINNSIKIILSGGEIMIRKNDVIEIINRYPNNKILLLSNGMFFTKPISKELSKFENLHIRVSLDGHNEIEHNYIRGKGSFKKVISGISNLKKENFNNISLSSTFSKDTTNSIPLILDLAEKLKIKSVKIEPIAKIGRAIEYFGPPPSTKPDEETKEFRYFASNNKKIGRWCRSVINDTKYNSITIYSNGDVYPFTFYNNYDRISGLVGNVYVQNLTEIISSLKWKKSILENILRFSLGPERSMGTFNYNYK